MSLSNPIDLHRVALDHPRANFVVPNFGWNRAVFDDQIGVFVELGVDKEAACAILGGNLSSLLGAA